MTAASSPVLDTAAARPLRRARIRRPLLAAHIAVAGAAVGADLVLLLLALSGLSGAEPGQVYPAMAMVGRWVLAPAALAVLVSGVVLARTSGYGLTTYWWVLIKLGISTVLTALAGLVLVPALGRAADAATRTASVADGQRLALVIPAAVGLSLLLLSVGLGVFKPRWRVPRRAG